MNCNNNTVPPVQRALVLQGGGALAAYEVGVLKVLCDDVVEKVKYNEQGQLFDIVAGTSIGAMNAAVLGIYLGCQWQKSLYLSFGTPENRTKLE